MSWPHDAKCSSDTWSQFKKKKKIPEGALLYLYKGFILYVCFYYATFSSCSLKSCVGSSEFDGSWMSDLYQICSVNLSGIRDYRATALALQKSERCKQSIPLGGMVLIELWQLWG